MIIELIRKGKLITDTEKIDAPPIYAGAVLSHEFVVRAGLYNGETLCASFINADSGKRITRSKTLRKRLYNQEDGNSAYEYYMPFPNSTVKDGGSRRAAVFILDEYVPTETEDFYGNKARVITSADVSFTVYPNSVDLDLDFEPVDTPDIALLQNQMYDTVQHINDFSTRLDLTEDRVDNLLRPPGYIENGDTPDVRIGAAGNLEFYNLKGNQGSSAYQVWLEQGNTGTVADYLKSLTGPIGLTGATGAQGKQGNPFAIKKVYSSITAMNSGAVADISEGEFALIETGDVNNPDNSKLYVKSGGTMLFITDLSGAIGLTPYIGENNNWWIGNEDTNVRAIGLPGASVGSHPVKITAADWSGSAPTYTLTITPAMHKQGKSPFLIAFPKPSITANELRGDLASPIYGFDGVITFTDVKPWEGYILVCGGIAAGGGVNLQSKTITPSLEEIIVVPDDGYNGLSSVTVEAVTAEVDENIKPENIRQGVSILGVTGEVIPAAYDYEAGFLDIISGEIEHLVVPDGVTSLAPYTFHDRTKLKSVILPDSVVDIGTDTFNGCTALESVRLSANLESIGVAAFSGCINLIDLVLPAGLKTIGTYAFSNCTSLTEIVIPDSVIDISASAFNGCTAATTITIGKNVNRIVSGVFAGCTAVTEINYNAKSAEDSTASGAPFSNAGSSSGITVNIGSEVKKIPGYLFYGSTSTAPKITSVIFAPNSQCVSIGTYAFVNNATLNDIIIPSSVTAIGASAFYNTGIINNAPNHAPIYTSNYTWLLGCKGIFETLTVPNTVVGIMAGALSGLSSLTYLSIPFVGRGRDIGITQEAHFGYIFGTVNFTDSTPITQYVGTSTTSANGTTYYIPKSLKTVKVTDAHTIYSNAFDGHNTLTEITINEGVTRIGTSAFRNCTSITELKLPESTTTIETYAFHGCLFKSLIIPENVISIAGSPFINCTDVETIDYNAISCELTAAAFRTIGTATSKIDVTIGKKVTIIPDNLFYREGTTSNIRTVTFKPDSQCQSVGENSFRDCTSLGSIILPPNITTIGNYAFSGCTALTSITLPDNLLTIGNYAFSGCTALTSITLPDNLLTIGNYAFQSCSSVTEIVIPDSVTEINGNAFRAWAKLVSITMPYIGATPESAVADSLFGYIFGTATYTGGTATAQNYSATSAATTYYLPTTLKKVRVSKQNVLKYGAFDGCKTLTHVYMDAPIDTIDTYSFRGATNLKIYFTAVPHTLSGVSAFSGATGTIIYIPYTLYNSLVNKTNWASVIAGGVKVYSYSHPNEFTVGATLPTTYDGRTLKWYSDEACTTLVTTVSNASAMYYSIAT